MAIRQASKRIFQISNEAGHSYIEANDINNVFVEFYQRLLGGKRTCWALDLRYLHPWAKHIIPKEETQALIQPIIEEEVKAAVFDIA